MFLFFFSQLTILFYCRRMGLCPSCKRPCCLVSAEKKSHGSDRQTLRSDADPSRSEIVLVAIGGEGMLFTDLIVSCKQTCSPSSPDDSAQPVSFSEDTNTPSVHDQESYFSSYSSDDEDARDDR